jgi:hypothetical protein
LKGGVVRGVLEKCGTFVQVQQAYCAAPGSDPTPYIESYIDYTEIPKPRLLVLVLLLLLVLVLVLVLVLPLLLKG